MILKLKMKDDSKKNIEIIKSHFFDPSDKITAGYIIGLAVERTTDISDEEWENAMKKIFNEKVSSKAKSTSVSLRQEIFDRITNIKERLQDLHGKTLYMSQVIDVILFIIANKLNSELMELNSLNVLEWNINARTGSANYIIPVNLILNEVFEKNPHIFVLTEFVKSVGWIDLKTMLEEKYNIYTSPYLTKQNGVCIGIRKECGIEYLGEVNKTSIFDIHLNLPDFYEIKVKINSQIISVIGARIRIDYYKANSKDFKLKTLEQKQRFEQYSNLVEYLAQLENVILLGDFNNSRILSDEKELTTEVINHIYSGKVSIDYNFQKIRAFIAKRTDKRMLLYTPDGDNSSIGAFWDGIAGEAKVPILSKNAKHKYDHLITNYLPDKLTYTWNFLKHYNMEHFSTDGKIIAGYPDHAVLLASIDLRQNN